MKNILIIGLGRFGRHIAIQFTNMGHEVMAVDIREDRVNFIANKVINAEIGDATNKAYLEQIGARDFDVCFVAIGDNFQTSLIATSALKELGARLVVSRASNGTHEKFLLRNGADEVIYPEKHLARWVAIRYSSEKIFDYMELEEGYAIYEISAPSAWVGKTIGDLNVRQKYKVNILGIKESSGRMDMSVSANNVICEGQHVLTLARFKDLQKLIKD